MSHHLDSPASRRDPRLNLTDMYVFDGESGTVLAMIVNPSLAGQGRISGFHPEARYEFKVHLDGAEREGLTYRVTFGEQRDDGEQPLTVHRVDGRDANDDEASGIEVAHGITGADAALSVEPEIRLWAGAAADPFYLDLGHLAHIIEDLQAKRPIAFGDWTQAAAVNSLTGFSVAAIVIEVARTDRRLHTGRQVSVWGCTKLATDAGGWRQINRAAIPLMWPLFRAIGGDDDSSEYHRATAAHPAHDIANDGPRVSNLIAAACRITGTANPDAYAEVVSQRLLPDVLPYRIDTPAAFSFAEFNGRGLADNAPEVMYSLITNTGFPTGLSADSAAETRAERFPYLVPAKPTT